MDSHMPSPGIGHQQLAALVGTWQGEEEQLPSAWGPASQRQGRYTMRLALGGFFLIQDYAQLHEGKTSFEGHGVLAWDAQQDRFTWYWVDSMGGAPSPSVGSFDGSTWVFLSSSPGHQGRYTWHLAPDGSLHFQLENRFGEADWAVFMRGVYRRVPAA